MTELLQDIRYSLRRFATNPGFTAVVVLTLAIGIGANAALFSVIEGVLLRPLPLAEPDRLVGTSLPLSVPDFFDWRDGISAFESLAVYNTTGFNLSGRAEPQRIRAAVVSAEFFPLLRVRPAQGRLFLTEEYSPSGGNTVLVAEDFWRRSLGSDPHQLGRALTLNGKPYTIVGILPKTFRFPSKIDLWTPYQLAPGGDDRGSNFLRVLARLRPGTSLVQTQMQVNALLIRLQRQYGHNQGRKVEIVPLAEIAARKIRPMLLVLLAAVGLVLLLACANVANLLLASAAARQHEVAVRSALGARRARLIRQLLTESFLLSLLSAALGLLFAYWGTRVLTSLIPAGRVPRWEEVGIDGGVLAFTLVVSSASSLLCGLAPAFQLSAVGLNTTLRQGSAGAGGAPSGRRLREALVVSEIALALLLLVSGGLAIEGFQRLVRVEPGFDPNQVLTLQLDLPKADPTESGQRIASLLKMVRRIESLPGVRAASVVINLPLSGNNINGSFYISGRPDPPPGQLPLVEYRFVAPKYFLAMAIPLFAGRDFSANDHTGMPPVVIINRTLARHFFPDSDPLGKLVAITGDDNHRLWMQVIGVAGDVHHFGLASAPVDELYMPLTQQAGPQLSELIRLDSFSLVVRAAGNPTLLSAPILRAIHEIDPGQPVSAVGTLRQLVAESLSEPRFEALLLALFAALALALAAAGTYSVMAYTVAQRTREIGLRMALGAHRGNVVKLVLMQVLRLTLIGVALGLLGTLATTRLLVSLLVGLKTGSPPLLCGVTVLLALTALVAALLPASRACKVEPMIAFSSD